eukprot:CAMPEP_0119048724 /NCGR_PEP_ID=MMETSP1177-20130426/60699_1 /TAXON_ID=2985 /ORGANISM="Ochromonas sp, Strain CCMP1899" /LENGTH=975 /DNA_ID=CAMNT_0007025033 /DNA_START=116 /DNA_END=3043 /DNA_ORIENTATION=+
MINERAVFNIHNNTFSTQIDTSSDKIDIPIVTEKYEIDAILEKMKTPIDFTSTHGTLVRAISQLSKDELIDLKANLLANEDTDGFDAIIAAEKSVAYVRQLNIEEEQQSDAVSEYLESLKQLISIGRGTSLKYVQRILLRWYTPLTQEIEEEVRLIEQKVAGLDRMQYGPCMLLLPAEKIAVIALDAVLNSILKTGNTGVHLTKIACNIGESIESEVCLIKLKKGKAGLRPWQQDLIKEAYSQGNFKRQRSRLNSLIEDEPWSNELKVKIGAALTSFVIETALTESNKPAFEYSKKQLAKGSFKFVGILKLNDDQFKQIVDKDLTNITPRYLPMLCPPKSWDNKKKDGCYYRLNSQLMRSRSRSQNEALRRANMSDVTDGLNYLGTIAWRINTPMYKIIKEVYERKLPCGGLPTVMLDLPKEEDCIRIIPPRRKSYAEIEREKNSKIDLNDPLDLKNDIDSDMKKHIDSDDKLPFESEETAIVEEVLSLEPQFDERYFKDMTKRVLNKNSEMHSLQCDMKLKFWVAENFLDEKFYYPHNLDFRGRAYPIPPNLNHLGSDVCRGLLMFDKEKPLGENGLFWMKVHISNLFGNNKITHHERAAFADDNMDKIIESAKNPLDGSQWWSTADEPFQALSTCMEIVAAIESGNPSEFLSRLPIHQDGSCNGLQHYAALGKDEVGGKSVNVSPSERPQDVYTAVLNILNQKVAKDILIDVDEKDEKMRYKGVQARIVQDVLNRRVIKQTVMTSVYGVTKVGARSQVQARLEERLVTEKGLVMTRELEDQLFGAASYVAKETLDSLNEMFVGAKGIMDWLTTCASLVASEGQVMSWITPLGLPVMQPYRKESTHTVRTVLQSITLAQDNDALPVSRIKQRSAFPPNFIHSLDASHMLMTTKIMKEKDLTFAAVHDSYWTHANDIPVMNEAVREQFVNLYTQPILENLRDSLVRRYPAVDFPPVPRTGTLDLQGVKQSTYFFH